MGLTEEQKSTYIETAKALKGSDRRMWEPFGQCGNRNQLCSIHDLEWTPSGGEPCQQDVSNGCAADPESHGCFGRAL